MTPLASEADMHSSEPGSGVAFSLNGGLDACSEARRSVLAAALPASARDDVLLLVSELVTNAVRHAHVGPDRSLRVELKQWPGRLRVEVASPGDGFVHKPVPPSSDGTGGWGLFLVDQIAYRWGITDGTGGTCVWFELRSEA
jgi:anti-sigma regulatory factor (Ser/Thr protein kinase)